MGHIPPKTVGSKSPTAKSSIFLSPSAVRIFVPFRKHFLCSLSSLFRLSLFWLSSLLWLFCAAAGLVFVKLAKSADAPIAPTFMRLRRDLWKPVYGLFRSGILLPPVLLGSGLRCFDRL